MEEVLYVLVFVIGYERMGYKVRNVNEEYWEKFWIRCLGPNIHGIATNFYKCQEIIFICYRLRVTEPTIQHVYTEYNYIKITLLCFAADLVAYVLMREIRLVSAKKKRLVTATYRRLYRIKP